MGGGEYRMWGKGRMLVFGTIGIGIVGFAGGNVVWHITDDGKNCQLFLFLESSLLHANQSLAFQKAAILHFFLFLSYVKLTFDKVLMS